MADPFTGTLAAVSAGTSILGGIVGASGAADKASAEAQSWSMKAAIARKNAAINKQNSDWTLEAGGYNAMRTGIATSFAIGKQKVAQAGSGFAVDGGTAEDVRDTQRRVGQMDQETIRTESGRKAKGFRNAGEMNEMEATLDDQSGANALKAGKTNVFSTLLGTGGSVADKWLKASGSFGKGSTGITTYGSDFEVTGFYGTG